MNTKGQCGVLIVSISVSPLNSQRINISHSPRPCCVWPIFPLYSASRVLKMTSATACPHQSHNPHYPIKRCSIWDDSINPHCSALLSPGLFCPVGLRLYFMALCSLFFLRPVCVRQRPSFLYLTLSFCGEILFKPMNPERHDRWIWYDCGICYWTPKLISHWK